MSINIQGKGCCSVAQVALDRFDIVSVLERQYCKSVSEIVHPAIWGSNFYSKLFVVV